MALDERDLLPEVLAACGMAMMYVSQEEIFPVFEKWSLKGTGKDHVVGGREALIEMIHVLHELITEVEASLMTAKLIEFLQNETELCSMGGIRVNINSMDLSWQKLGACYGMYYHIDEDIWFPPENPGGPKEGKGVAGEKERVRRAIKICQDCPVRQECLEYAIAGECVGVWGGMDTNERRAYARKIAA